MVSLKNQPHIVAYEEHRIIPRVSGLGYDLFLRMELLTSLPAWLRRSGHEPGRDFVVRLGIDLSSALEIMEAHGIIHRDIKPANVFVDREGSFKLGDFGTARVLSATQQASFRTGTLYYMAPEVYAGHGVYDHTVDIYSLGMMLYLYMNHGMQPWGDPGVFDPEGLMLRRMSGEPLPPPAMADEELARIILKCCAPRPEDRYAHAADLRRELEACFRGRQGSSATAGATAASTGSLRGCAAPQSGPSTLDRTIREPAPSRPTPEKKRNPGPVIAIAASAVAVCLGLVLLLPGMKRETAAVPTEAPAATEPAGMTDAPIAVPTEAPTEAPADTPAETVMQTPVPTAVPPMIGDLRVSDRGTNYLRLTWSRAFGEEAVELYSRLHGETSWSYRGATDGAAITLTELQGGRAYDVRLVAPDGTELLLESIILPEEASPTPSSTPSPTSSPTPSPVPTPTAEPTHTPAPTQKLFCVIKNNGSYARSGPGTEYDLVRALSANSRYLILETARSSTGRVWYRINADGVDCWISSNLATTER